MTSSTELFPSQILICCEGKETEPQYFKIIADLWRIRQQVRIKIVGNKGQYKKLIDESVILYRNLLRDKELDPIEVEVWAVCDKDNMRYSLLELEEYAQKNNVNLAFSDPMFEIFLLQHFTASTSSASTKRELETLLNKELQIKNPYFKYNKSNLAIFENIFYTEPSLVKKKAILNCRKLEDKTNSPYTSCHKLLERLLELAP